MINLGNNTTSLAYGTYTKIGRAVTLCGLINTSGESGATSSMWIAGLPFTCAAGEQYKTTVAIWPNGLGGNKVKDWVAEVAPGTSIIYIYRGDSAAITDNAVDDVDEGIDLRINVTYFV